MEIVGSDEQMACVGFALTPLWVMDASTGDAKNVAGTNVMAEEGGCKEWWKTRGASVTMRQCGRMVIRLYDAVSPRCPTKWSSLSSKRILNVVRLP